MITATDRNAGQDVTLYGEVERIRHWIRRANAVLGIAQDDESEMKAVAKPEAQALAVRCGDCVGQLNAPLGVRLEVILKEMHMLKDLVG